MEGHNGKLSEIVSITLEDLRSFDFGKVLSKKSSDSGELIAGTCDLYTHNFANEAKHASESGDSLRASVCEIFRHVTSFRYKLHNSVDHTRFIALKLRSEYSCLFAAFAREIQDAELRARIADILWFYCVGEHYKFAELAVDAYIKSAARLDMDTETRECANRLDRALQIASALGKTGQAYRNAIDAVKAQLEIWRDANTRVGSSHLLRLLVERREGDPCIYASYARELAESLETDGDWEGARTAWRIAEGWHKLLNNETASSESRLRAAQTYEEEAKLLAQLNKNTNAELKVIQLLKSGIHALRQAQGRQSEIDRVHDFLLDCQRRFDGFQEFEDSVDLTDVANETTQMFADLSPLDTVLKLSALIAYESPPFSHQICQAREQMQASPMHRMFGTELQDSIGRTIAKSPGIGASEDGDLDAEVLTAAFQNARQRHEIVATARILPVVRQLNSDRHLLYEDFLELVVSNPFIPRDRRSIFLRGLYYGICGDFMVATHLLIPQIENSIRYVLEQHGVRVSGMNQEGIQEPFALGHLLYNVPEVENIFGEDLVFELKALFVERFGSNMRNRLSHGLISDDESMSLGMAYAWGFILRLVCHPVLAARADQTDSEVPEE